MSFTILLTRILISVHLFAMTGENSLIARIVIAHSIRCALFASAAKRYYLLFSDSHKRVIESQSDSNNLYNNDVH